MNSNNILVKLNNVGFRQNGKWLVEGVSLNVEKGKIITLIGPNGSGKSTTAKIALGIYKNIEGSVEKYTNNVGYVPQKISIDWTLPLRVSDFMVLTENIKDDEGIYGKLNTLMLIASIQLWKKNHPTDNCVMYCDKLTLRYLERLSIGHLWDSIEEYTHTRNIDRTVFWAASKVAVLSQQTEPVILMDNDTLVYKPITHLLDTDTNIIEIEFRRL